MSRFLRVAELVVQIPQSDYGDNYIASITIQNLRVAFSIVKSIAWAGNTAVLKVWGLKQETRNLIRQFGTQVTLNAGYADDAGPQLCYIGQTIAVYHTYQQPEIVTTFECIDGDKYFNQAKTSVSYAAGTLAATVLGNLAKQINIQVAPFTIDPNLQYKTGFSYTGPTREGIFKAAEFLGLQATIQNSILYIVPLKGVNPSTIFEVNENTGMIGIPERYTYRRLWEYRAVDAPTVGYRVAHTLRPLIKPTDQVLLTSSHLAINRQPHRVETVRHNGDTYGPEWLTSMELTLIPPNAVTT